MYCLILFCSCKSFGKFISIPSTKLYLITNHQLSELGKNTLSEPSLDGVAGEYETEFIKVLWGLVVILRWSVLPFELSTGKENLWVDLLGELTKFPSTYFSLMRFLTEGLIPKTMKMTIPCKTFAMFKMIDTHWGMSPSLELSEIARAINSRIQVNPIAIKSLRIILYLRKRKDYSRYTNSNTLYTLSSFFQSGIYFLWFIIERKYSLRIQCNNSLSSLLKSWKKL